MRAFKLTIALSTFLIFGICGTAFAQYSGTGSNSNVEYVSGYTKSNGTYVKGYYRTKANSYNLDNFSAKGNYNSYTGDYGTRKYDSPYNSYNSSSTYTRPSSYNRPSYNYNSNFSSDLNINTDYSGSYESSYDYDYSYDSIYDY